MIRLPESTKNQYKDYNREIKVVANLYLAKKRESKNLFNINGEVNVNGNTGQVESGQNTVSGNILTCNVDGYNYHAVGQKITGLTGKTITFSARVLSLGTGQEAGIYIYENGTWRKSATTTINKIISCTYKTTTDEVITAFVTSNGTGAQFTDIQVEIGFNKSDYEEYGIIVNDYNSIFKPSSNVFDKDSCSYGFLMNDGGIRYDLDDYVYSEIIDKRTFSTFYISGLYTEMKILYYDYNKTSVEEYVNVTENGQRYSNYPYMRVCLKKQYINTLQLLLEPSTKYVPYNKLLSKNIFNIRNLILIDVHGPSYINYNSGTIILENLVHVSYQTLQELCPSMEAGKTYTLSFTKETQDNYTNLENYIYLEDSQYTWYEGTSHTITSNELNSRVYFYGGEYQSTDKYYMTDIQIEEGTNKTPYERYNSTPFKLNENNECQILDFNIDEKGDIYYSSLPYNTMTINVNNEQGYFTEEAENNILDKLNKDCYIDLFMKINDDIYYKIMTMNLNDVKYADYQKARLEFYSCLYKINNAKEMLDKDKILLAKRRLTEDDWRTFLNNNFNISCISNVRIDSTFYESKDLKSFTIQSSSRQGQEKYGEISVTDYNNNLISKKLFIAPRELIPQNLQLEKAMIKKQDVYRNIKYIYYDTSHSYDGYTGPAYVETTETYSQVLFHKLQSKRDVLVFYDKNYKLNDITQNDVTISSDVGNVSGIVETTNVNNNLIEFTLEGNIGDSCYIQIIKPNIYKLYPYSTVTYGFRTDAGSDKKILIVNEGSPIMSGIYSFLFIKKPPEAFIEAKIMGLPYLEIGDTIQIELEDKIDKFIITEINTMYDSGLTQTIKGYRLEWEHQAEEPYTDLNEEE